MASGLKDGIIALITKVRELAPSAKGLRSRPKVARNPWRATHKALAPRAFGASEVTPRLSCASFSSQRQSCAPLARLWRAWASRSRAPDKRVRAKGAKLAKVYPLANDAGSK
jgi:hypothetical protein